MSNGRPMRWFVEISSIGASSEPPVRLCVDAPQWQPALQKARALRGDEGPLSNFSIELLDEGYRAVDPATRKKYFVRKAPDDAPITNSAAEAVPFTPIPSQPPPADKPSQAPPPAATSADKPKPKSMTQTAGFGSTGAAVVRPEPAETPAPNPAKVALPPKRPTQQGLAAAQVPIRKATVPGMAAVAAPLPPPPPSSNAPVPLVTKVNVPAPTPAPVALPAHKVHSSREENASSASPLTYREYVYVVAEGTSEDAARSLLLDRFEQLENTLADLQGKLVHMAVFDHAYQGKPQRKPLATLAWRDWRGDPVIVFPSREKSAAKETQTPAPGRSLTPPPAKISVPPAAPKPSTPPPPAVKASVPPPKASTSPPPAIKASVPPPKASVPPPKASVPPPRTKTADEVMAEISGAITDMHFLRDGLEGADFILKLVNEKFPSELVLIWFYDADKRELVLVRQAGGKTDPLLMRIPEKSGLAQAAIRSQRAVVIPDAARDPRANEARWKTIGIEPKSMVIAPAMASGKPYGLVEVLNPKSGGRFSSIENNALTYIGQQLAEFLSSSGVILDAERILVGAKRIAP